MTRVAICAPSTPFNRADAARVAELAREEYPALKLHFHEQCFAESGHFAGPDELRLAAFLECANDPAVDAVWFARGGYGASRIAELAIGCLTRAASAKTYLGYSDAGYLLGALYGAGIGRAVHAPMAVDIKRPGGEAAIRRVLAFLTDEHTGVEPRLDHRPAVAFNLTTLAMALDTPLMPDLADHVVLVEEVSEHLYAIDRLFFSVTARLRGVAGLRLGRIGDVPENDRPFGAEPEEIARYWCERHAIPFLGTADIGHDSANRIVPFGLASGKKHS